ncbi:hypothetical protein BGW80DRAFT_1333246 [Lactifluus volemus]|nr:hypothetical protein BGW80DRAFT_1333246 [Lactifluus volemus]
MRAAFESCHKGWGISVITESRLPGKEISPREYGRGGVGMGTSGPSLSGHSLLVPPELGGGDSHDGVNGTEPQWL